MPGTDIDTSVYGTIKPPAPIDPLATMGKVQDYQRGVLNNRLLGQQVGGKEATGRAVTKNTKDGKTDWQGALSDLAADPQGSFAVPELAGQVLDREIKNTQLSKEQLGLSSERWKLLGDTTGALLADQAPLTRDSVIKTLADNLIGSGLYNDESSVATLTKFVQNMPNDDKQLRAYLKNAALTSNMTTERINALLGAPSTVNTGAQTIQQQVSPLTGEIRVNGVVDNTRTPGEKAALVPTYNPATQQFESKPSGALLGDMAPGALPQAGVSVAQAPGLGVAEAAQGGVQQAQQLREVASRVPETKAALKNISDQIGKFTSGPQATWIYKAKALATQLGLPLGQMKDEVAAQEEFNKLATQFINAQVGSLGGESTDAKLRSAMHGSPNELLSREGASGIINLMMGLEDAKAVKNLAWQKWLDSGKGPGTYDTFQTAFNQRFNPRVFQSQYMTEAQRQNMMRNMTPEERNAFKKDVINAQRYGWVK